MQEKSLTIYGKGTQTRSFCFIFDLIDGLDKLMESQYKGPFNLGNPEETKINDLAKLIKEKVNREIKIIYSIYPENDPYKRKPDINFGQEVNLIGNPKVSLYEGLNLTIQYFKTNFKFKMKIKNICCIGAGYVGGPSMAVIADKCPEHQMSTWWILMKELSNGTKDLSKLPIYEP